MPSMQGASIGQDIDLRAATDKLMKFAGVAVLFSLLLNTASFLTKAASASRVESLCLLKIGTSLCSTSGSSNRTTEQNVHQVVVFR